MKKIKEDEADREIAQYMYRSALMSMVWSVVSKRGNSRGFKQELADALDIDKSTVSRWFSGVPNWEANTVADIANVLDIDIEMVAVDRQSGQRYSPTGPQAPAITATSGIAGQEIAMIGMSSTNRTFFLQGVS